MNSVLITGASGGIGETFARRLAADGRDLFLVARSGDRLQAICEELSRAHSISAEYFAVDLSKPGADKAVFEECERRGIQVDWLINNAGFGSMGDFAELDIERELAMIELNVVTLVGLTHRFLGPMRDRLGGVVINVSSAAGFQPIPFMATYAATKSFVTAFTEAVAAENEPFGIQMIALCPGSTQTGFFEASNIDRAIKAKGQQTPEQVVDTALGAVRSRRKKVISGWTNWAVASATNFLPNSLITKLIARGIRGRYQGEKTRQSRLIGRGK